MAVFGAPVAHEDDPERAVRAALAIRPPEQAERKLADTVSDLVVDGAERMLESLRPLVGISGEAERGSDLRADRFVAWRQFLEALAERGPTVLVFEDLHWDDDDLLDFVDHLVDWGTGVPLLVVCTARPELPERRPGWGGGKPNALTLSISPLSDEETARLLASLLDRAVLPADLQASVLARAGGNPLYAEQFAKLIAETERGEELPLPENVLGIIAARLDGLPLAEKQLLQDAAVLGKERADLLLDYGRSRFDDVAFDEKLLDEATEGLLRQGNREAAAEAQSMVGTIWLNRGDRHQAFEHLERARRLVEDRAPSPAKAFVLQEVSRAAMMGDDFERAIELASESLRLAEEFRLDAMRARNLNTLGVARVHGGDEAGVHDLEQAVAIGAAANSHEECAAAANLAWLTAALGDLRRAWDLHEECRRIADRLGLDSYIRWQRAEHVFHCHWQGRWDEALAMADEFVREVEAGSSHYMESACRSIRGSIRLVRGDPAAALADAARATEVVRGTRDPQVLNPALAFEARATLAVGDREGAGAIASELLTAWSKTGVRPTHESVDGAWALRDLGRSEELAEVHENAPGTTSWHEAARRIAAAI